MLSAYYRLFDSIIGGNYNVTYHGARDSLHSYPRVNLHLQVMNKTVCNREAGECLCVVRCEAVY